MRAAILIGALWCALQASAQSSVLYGGGSGDGHGTTRGEQPMPSVFWFGGAGDGHATRFSAPTTAVQTWFGGSGDGHAQTGSGTPGNPVLFAGGSGDGHASTWMNNTTTTVHFRGGTGDGHAVAMGTTAGPVAQWYGGPNDGYADGKGDLQFNQLRVVAKLDGPFDTNTGLMRDDMRSQGLLPLGQPYTALGFALTGNEPSTTTAPVLTTTGANAIVDWVYLELRPTTNTSLILTTITALMQRDGDIVAMDGTSPPTFRIAAGTYHLVIRHRNHLAVMSAQPLTLGWLPQPIDLTANAASFFGTNATRTVNGVQVLWAGDVNGNGQVQYTGSGNDRDPILTTVGSTTPNNVASNTYSTRDVNLDGSVKYTGPGNDRDPILLSVGNTTPNNIRVVQVP